MEPGRRRSLSAALHVEASWPWLEWHIDPHQLELTAFSSPVAHNQRSLASRGLERTGAILKDEGSSAKVGDWSLGRGSKSAQENPGE